MVPLSGESAPTGEQADPAQVRQQLGEGRRRPRVARAVRREIVSADDLRRRRRRGRGRRAAGLRPRWWGGTAACRPGPRPAGRSSPTRSRRPDHRRRWRGVPGATGCSATQASSADGSRRRGGASLLLESRRAGTRRRRSRAARSPPRPAPGPAARPRSRSPRRARPRSRRPRSVAATTWSVVSKAVTVARMSRASVSQATDATSTPSGPVVAPSTVSSASANEPGDEQRRLEQVAVAQHPAAGAGPVAQAVARAVVGRRQGAGLLVDHGQAVAATAYVGQRRRGDWRTGVAHAATASTSRATMPPRSGRLDGANHDGGLACVRRGCELSPAVVEEHPRTDRAPGRRGPRRARFWRRRPATRTWSRPRSPVCSRTTCSFADAGVRAVPSGPNTRPRCRSSSSASTPGRASRTAGPEARSSS